MAQRNELHDQVNIDVAEEFDVGGRRVANQAAADRERVVTAVGLRVGVTECDRSDESDPEVGVALVRLGDRDGFVDPAVERGEDAPLSIE